LIKITEKERKLMEDNERINPEFSQRRSEIVSALNTAVNIFTTHNEKDFYDVMSNGIKPIACAAGLDMVVFYRSLCINGEKHIGQIYRWDREKGGLISLNEGLRHLPKIPVLDQWILTLSKNNCIRIRESEMSSDELAFLCEFGIKSILIIPVFSHGEFWGAVSLQDHTNDRYFDEGCIDLLLSSARLCANAIIRAEMFDNANKAFEEEKRREKMANILNKMSVKFLSQSRESFEAMMTEGVRLITDMMNIDRMSVWRNTAQFDGLHTSQIYRWDRESGGTTVPTSFFEDVTYSQLAPSWENILAEGNTINSPARMLPKGEGEMLLKFGVVSLFVTPIILNNAFWGFVLFEDRQNERYFEDDFSELLRTAAFLCANTVMRADMEHKLKVRLEQQELITEITRSFVSSDETGTLVKQAIAKLGHHYKVSNVVIFCLDYQSKDANLAYHWSADGSPLNRTKINMQDFLQTSFPERMYDCATVPVLSCTDTTSGYIEFFRILLADGVNAFICAPLYVEGRLWGFMSVEQCSKSRQWTDNEKNFVASTASTIAGAIMLDMYNTKLKDAVVKVTAASKAKSEFLSNMSHEMRTPMNAIINMTVIGKNSQDMERKNYSLDKIQEASTHLLGVINDILDMSKIEANKFELMPVEFNFEKMLGRVINVINFRVEEKHQKFIVNVDKNIPNILIGDDQRISQVITNLLGNAVKFTPKNGTILLNTEFLEEKNNVCTIKISIKDSGIGISKEHQKHLFQSFQQAETSTARNYGGTGLGLSISKSFVEMMGGNIWVESESGKGSTFSFMIKVKIGSGNKEQHFKNEQKKNNVDFTGHRILLVEDMMINREIVIMMLESTHLEIECAVNGIQALEMFIEEPNRYEVIFMDVHMPGMDGYEATRQIRSFEEKLKQNNPAYLRKRVPIIAMTANVFKEDIDNCLKSGMDDHIGKPLDFDIVMDKLRQYVVTTGGNLQEHDLFH